jgi:putative phosphoserine phosphatase/1-acylglycerol-3-phosphate O-acyltransferase
MTELRLPGTVAEIEASPKSRKIGALFDLDGTLIAGYSAQHLATQRLRNREFSAGELIRTLGVVASAGGMNQDAMAEMLEIAGDNWRGRAREDLDEMGLRLFEKKTADLIYPEMREIVRAHQDRGHTVALTSSATAFQVEPVAAYLGIDHIVCNRFEDEDGILTGKVMRPVLWGPGKAEAVQAFAAEQGLDLDRSYFYADGDEDVALMYLVGQPRPTNPGDHLESVARKRGWPVVKLDSRGKGSMLRTLGALGSLLPIAAAGVGVGLVQQDERAATNFVSENWMKAMFAFNSVEINVVNEHNAWEQRPAVFLFNHRNGFDPFIATKIIKKDFTAVAKGELRNDPIVGTFGRFMDIAFVDRGDTKQSVDSLKPIEELAEKGLSVIIAPEGTRLDTKEVGPFKKGPFRIAMAAKIPIVPIVIRNAEMIGGRNATTMNPGSVDVAVLPPIPTKKWKLDDLEANMAMVRQQFLDTLADWPTEDE